MNASRRRSPGNGQSGQAVSALLLVTLVAAAALLGIYLGKRAAYSDISANPQSQQQTQVALIAARKELAEVRGELEVQRTRHEVDRQALEMVRKEMAARKEQTSGLEEDLRFYRSLMAPESSTSGLSLRAPELVALGRPDRVAYRIVIQQRASKHEMVKGSLTAEVYGFAGEQEQRYSLAELAPEASGEPVALLFRYFQTIEGEVTLPEGFEPRGIDVVASASKPQKTEVREQFPWQLQERFTNVGN